MTPEGRPTGYLGPSSSQAPGALVAETELLTPGAGCPRGLCLLWVARGDSHRVSSGFVAFA